MTEVTRLFDIPYYQVEQHNLEIAFATKYNDDWIFTSTENYIKQINALSNYLLNIGVLPNDKIAIITDRNRAEWHIADIAIMQIGAQSVPIYDSTSSNEMAYIFKHAEVKYCFVSNEKLFKKITTLKKDYFALKKIISFDDAILNCISFNNAIETGNKLNFQDRVNTIKKTIKSNDLATIIYTSGTTDKPKGVMLTHQNIISNLFACIPVLPEFSNEPVNALSFLPVSHIFERMMLYLYQYNGFSIYFAQSIDTIAVDMKEVKPQILTVVPRLLEKIHDKIIEKGNTLSGIKKKFFKWALEIGYKYEPYGENGKSYERSLKRARKLVFKKWQEVFGGNVKVIFCGSSKLQPRLAKIFNAANIPVMDGYGLTETSPVISVNSPNNEGFRIGTIGKPLNNVHVKISADGEILSKGPNNMVGYYKNNEKTENSFIDGYFKTGDLGKIDEDGFIYITGRKKETFKTSGGKYISPTKIEIEIKKSPYIEQIVIIGENEKFPAAIIQPNYTLLREWINTNNFEPISDNLELISNNNVLQKIQDEIDIVNENLGQWERIKRFELTEDEWSVDAGHLTPTLKVKKDIIKSKYYVLFNKIYRPYNF